MNKTTWAATTWAASAAFLLTACSGSLSQVRNGQTDHPVWPQANQARPVVKAWFKPNPENLRKVQQGLRVSLGNHAKTDDGHLQGLAAVSYDRTL